MRERHSMPSMVPSSLQRPSSDSVLSPSWRSTTSRVRSGETVVGPLAWATIAVNSVTSESAGAAGGIGSDAALLRGVAAGFGDGRLSIHDGAAEGAGAVAAVLAARPGGNTASVVRRAKAASGIGGVRPDLAAPVPGAAPDGAAPDVAAMAGLDALGSAGARSWRWAAFRSPAGSLTIAAGGSDGAGGAAA